MSAHPALAPYADFGELAATPGLAAWNARARAAGLAHPSGARLRFVAQETRSPALAYERRIAAAGEIPLREGDPHDAWNARVWLAFPRTKSALNAIHVVAGAAEAPNARSPGRDAATLLDESGALVACIDPEFVACWRRHAWREAFGGPAAALARRLAVVVVGHGLLARLDRPFRGLTAKALILPLDPVALPADRGRPPGRARRRRCGAPRWTRAAAWFPATSCRCRSRRWRNGTRRQRATRASPTCRFFARCGGRGTAPPRHSVGEASVAMLTS